MVDLGTLGGSSSYADAVNDNGQVAGFSTTSRGTTHAVLWSVSADTDLAIGPPPADITALATGPAGAAVTYTPPTATDEGGETAVVTCDHPSGSTFAVGNTAVTCTATDSDDTPSSVSESFNVTVDPAPQTITFGSLSDTLYGAAPFAVSASASSGLPVSLASTTPSVCTVSGITVSVLQPGTCSLTANQAGNADYQAATPVTQFFAVGFSSPCITTTIKGGLTVTSGQAICLNGGTVDGGINVQSGGALWVNNSNLDINGSTIAVGATALTVCGAHLHGGITAAGTTGQVNIGGAVCITGNTISGSVSLTANTGGVTYSNNTVTGSVTITNNSGGFTFASNTTGGTLTVSNNT
jgi:probable HAF family extracellular repeat protein